MTLSSPQLHMTQFPLLYVAFHFIYFWNIQSLWVQQSGTMLMVSQATYILYLCVQSILKGKVKVLIHLHALQKTLSGV